MMMSNSMRTLWSTVLLASVTSVLAAGNDCKCIPNQPCWPSSSQWQAFNASLAGRLIRDVQPASVCYEGARFNAAACEVVFEKQSNSTFLADTAIGLDYPGDIPPCPALNPKSGASNATCHMGDTPVYSVDASSSADVSKGVQFAAKHNLRLVIRSTGHDILGRSTGYGSLQIWLRNLRSGINYTTGYSSSCRATNYTGHAVTIGGSYTWGDVLTALEPRNVVVVSGGDPSVGATGGWMQGGGHGVAVHDFGGLGADQLLSATVVLADGSVVVTDICHYPDLFFAIRGGGGGSYGIVVSTTVKAYDDAQAVVVQQLAFAPLTSAGTSTFLSAVADVYQAYPHLSDGGFSGYGSWALQSPAPIFANFTTGFVHAIASFGKGLQTAQAVGAPLVQALSKYNGTSLFVSVSYVPLANYRSYYNTFSGQQQPVGVSGALGSRFLDRAALTGNRQSLEQALNTSIGTPEEFTQVSIEAVGGGDVAKNHSDSGVNPAWRTAYVHNIVSRGWAPGSSKSVIDAVHHDITYNKVGALKKLAPNTGCYMNEADVRDPDYEQDFYGENYAKLLSIKAKYDPGSLFYCDTCVGSAAWTYKGKQLCRI